ncbi:MAG: HAMP domain-containing sensor histidine kinase [Sulfurimonas sp.]|nr:HAMP domain-containing sensor histidine kinase [Sulfurimonas sp.]
MKNLSIITQIALINVLVMSLFMGIFIYKNYTLVSNQLGLLEDEKIDSIVKTLVPTISINLTLGLEENLKEIMNNSMAIHHEIVAIEVLSKDNQMVYNSYKENIKSKKVYQVALKDTILKTQIGELRVYYTFSSIYSKLLDELSLFLIFIIFFFIISLLIASLLVKYNLSPLKSLKDKMLSYSLNNQTKFTQEDFKNEIYVINNSAAKMIQKIEEEIEKRIIYEKEIMQKNRLASMGEMIDNIAHQWRQPLMKVNAVLLNLDRNIELKSYDDAYLKEKIEDISNTLFFMSNTIDTFREFLSPNKAKGRFEISNSIEKVFAVLNTSLHDVTIDCNKKELFIEAFESEFMQVIISIISNAIDVFEQRAIEYKKLSIDIFEDTHNIFVSIEDNAQGIEQSNLDKIFDPYFTTKHKTGGTGMGLYISKMIMNSSFGGDILVKNSSKGAKFILKISKEEVL